MVNTRIGEWMWRFLALSMLVMVAWMAWVLYQLSPPQTVLKSAYEAFSAAKVNELQNPKQTVQGTIATVSASGEPLKPSDAAPAGTSAAPSPTIQPPKPAAEAAAATEPVAAKPSAAEVIDAVQAWARAWSAKDLDAYLSCYSKDFLTPFGERRSEWEMSRRQRIGAPKNISVTVDSPDVEFSANDKASVTFKQGYRSDLVTSGATAKTLVMIKADGRWLIQQEFAAN